MPHEPSNTSHAQGGTRQRGASTPSGATTNTGSASGSASAEGDAADPAGGTAPHGTPLAAARRTGFVLDPLRGTATAASPMRRLRAAMPALPTVPRETAARAGVLGIGLAIGALLGAGIALLLAPQSGEDTRDLLRRRARGIRMQAGDGWSELGDELRYVTRRQRRELRRKARRARWAASDFVEHE